MVNCLPLLGQREEEGNSQPGFLGCSSSLPFGGKICALCVNEKKFGEKLSLLPKRQVIYDLYHIMIICLYNIEVKGNCKTGFYSHREI